jgi:hypothetical protein
MNDDRATQDPDDAALESDAPTDGGKLDEYDDAVIAADDTGMLAGERMITLVTLDEGDAGSAAPEISSGEGDV